MNEYALVSWRPPDVADAAVVTGRARGVPPSVVFCTLVDSWYRTLDRDPAERRPW